MIEIVTSGFELRPTHLNMLRSSIAFEDIDAYKPDTKLYLELDNNLVTGKWINEDISKEIQLPVENLDSETTIKLAIYKLVKLITNVDLPWGILTGIRPVRYLEQIRDQYKDADIKKLFIDDLMVKEDKYNLIDDILETQKPILKLRDDSFIVYIHIPFCPTRCKYCSFSVMSMEGRLRYSPSEYVDYLLKEIEDYNGYMNPKKPVSLYIGGGTPSILGKEDVDRIFSIVREKFGDIKEITFEAGRPDTINEDLLKALRDNNVNRISVNPQTLKQETLDKIGRKHKVEDFYSSFKICKNYGFNINTDIIIGLENETINDIKETIDKLLNLQPDDITIHSLALKNGSYYINHDQKFAINNKMDQCFDYSYDRLRESGYKPYYLYRQKRQVGNNENIGFTKSQDLNLYNILSMDDKCDVLAFGMGAVSKFTSDDGIVKRVFGFRDIDYYINHYKELNKLKEEARKMVNNIKN